MTYYQGIINGERVKFTVEDNNFNHKVFFKEDDLEIISLYNIYKLKTQIQLLKKSLQDTDYVICKIVEGVSTLEECSDILNQRNSWRHEINVLEEELKWLQLEGH